MERDGIERQEIAVDLEAGLLAEFAARGGERIFAVVVLTLRERPCAVVFLRPKWSAEVDEKNLDVRAASAIQRNPRTHSWHDWSIDMSS